MKLEANVLADACADDGVDAGITIRTELQPLAGPGEPVKPAVYAGGLYQKDRRWDGEADRREPVDVVVIDNTPSQANRLEDALLRWQEPLGLPQITLDLSGLEPLPSHLPRVLSSLQFPHRQADAYLRDATLDGKPFERSEVGERLFQATRENALALLEWFPQTLLYGFWQSHLGKKMSQAKLARSWVSEIAGIRPATTETRVLGLKGDPLNLSTDEKVEFDPDDVAGWQLTESKREGKKGEKLSEIGHGQVPFKSGEEALAGLSFERIEQRATVSFAGLRQIRVGNPEENAAARALVAALGLVAHVAAFGASFKLRSGCDLRPVSTNWAWLGGAGDETLDPLTLDAARELFAACVEAGEKLGLPVGKRWPAPLTLVPSEPLAAVIRKTYPAGE